MRPPTQFQSVHLAKQNLLLLRLAWGPGNPTWSAAAVRPRVNGNHLTVAITCQSWIRWHTIRYVRMVSSINQEQEEQSERVVQRSELLERRRDIIPFSSGEDQAQQSVARRDRRASGGSLIAGWFVVRRRGIHRDPPYEAAECFVRKAGVLVQLSGTKAVYRGPILKKQANFLL